MPKGFRFPLAFGAAVASLVLAGNLQALAFSSGTIGYDVGYPQCGSSYPRAAGAAMAFAQLSQMRAAWWNTSRRTSSTTSTIRPWYRSQYSFGIVGVDSGYPFMSANHPGNPCLADEYAKTPNPGLYINTGYDPSYTDSNHTTADCRTQSATISGSAGQQAAWAVGCSEAQGDYGYASSKGITSPAGWWLDVETGNSWCGGAGTACTDLSLNQYTIQGIIDTLTHIGAVPIGVYSNRSMWSRIVGTRPISGHSADWVASGTSTSQQAATYCNSGFSGAPVALVQFLSASIDKDYAC